MPQLRTSAPFDAPADLVLSIIADVEAYSEFMPGIASSRTVEVLDMDDDGTPLEYEVEVAIGLSIFNGKLAARVERDTNAGTLAVSLIRGPVRRAECRVEVKASGANSSDAIWDIDYETPSSVIDKLIGLYQDPAFHRVVAAFQDRAQWAVRQQTGVR